MFGVLFDLQQRALVWPVRAHSNKLLGFTRRYLPGHQLRYEYPRGFTRPLFPCDKFRGSRAILVEGPLDAMWLHQHGYYGALATLGTSVTAKQLAWLRAHVAEVVLMFDNDPAGKAVTQKLLPRLLEFRLWLAKLPDDVKDPQELSAEQLEKALAEIKPFGI